MGALGGAREEGEGGGARAQGELKLLPPSQAQARFELELGASSSWLKLGGRELELALSGSGVNAGCIGTV